MSNIYSPKRELTRSILTLCSLIPGTIQESLNDSAILYDKESSRNVSNNFKNEQVKN